MTVADALVERLLAWGVRRIYGYPGDGINGVIGSIDRAGGKLNFVEPRHEAGMRAVHSGNLASMGAAAPSPLRPSSRIRSFRRSVLSGTAPCR